MKKTKETQNEKEKIETEIRGKKKKYYSANFVDGWRKGPQVKECRWPLETLNVKEGDSYLEPL